MTRNICICLNKSLFQPINGFDSVDVNNLDRVVNYSIHIILVDNLNILNSSESSGVLQQLLTKLAVGGQLVIRFIDAKILAKKYLENIISDQDYLEYLKALQSIWSIDGINDVLDTNFAIDKIDQSDFNTMIKVIRTNI